MKMIVAGSHSLPPGSSSFAFPIIDALTPEDTVLLRSPKYSEPAHFEHIIAAYCRYRNVPFKFVQPEPTEDAPGRVSVYLRDVEMVNEADGALLFFSPNDAITGSSGTMHVLEKALDAEIRTDAFVVQTDPQTGRIYAERFGGT